MKKKRTPVMVRWLRISPPCNSGGLGSSPLPGSQDPPAVGQPSPQPEAPAHSDREPASSTRDPGRSPCCEAVRPTRGRLPAATEGLCAATETQRSPKKHVLRSSLSPGKDPGRWKHVTHTPGLPVAQSVKPCSAGGPRFHP